MRNSFLIQNQGERWKALHFLSLRIHLVLKSKDGIKKIIMNPFSIQFIYVFIIGK